MALVTSSVAWVQRSIIFRYLSSSVIKPRRYCLSITSTFSSVVAKISFFAAGILISDIAIVIPALHANENPKCFMPSKIDAVLALPNFW